MQDDIVVFLVCFKIACNKNKWSSQAGSGVPSAFALTMTIFRGTQRQNFAVGVGTSFLRYNCAFCKMHLFADTLAELSNFRKH